MAAPFTVKCPSGLFLLRQFINARFPAQKTRIALLSQSSRDYATDTTQSPHKDPFPLYASKEVQTLLRRMTGFELMKIAGPKKTPLQQPSYKLLTDSELSQEQDAAKERLSHYLDNPPPYMNPRKPVTKPLAVDPELAHFDTSRYIFSDVSFGVKDRERSVVVREVDGTLRVAPWDLKERMNQLYNPREGRSIIKPQMFEEHHIERLISEKKFCYILERACAQFEPDDPDFLRACHRVYSAINATYQHNALRSTCFFAPLSFHLVWTNDIDHLLIDMLTRDLESDAVDLITLYCVVHHQGACAQAVKELKDRNVEAVVKAFLEADAKLSSDVELALQAMMDRKKVADTSSVSSQSQS